MAASPAAAVAEVGSGAGNMSPEHRRSLGRKGSSKGLSFSALEGSLDRSSVFRGWRQADEIDLP